MQSSETRVRYQSDYSASWSLLPVAIAVALFAAVVLAWFMKLAYVCGWYLIFLLPLLCGLVLGGVVYATVGWICCRNHWLAATLGILAGLICYLGYYDLCLRDMLPPGIAWRIEMLPKYIKFRMKTDVQNDVGAPENVAARRKPVDFLNWWTFVWELGIIVGIGGGTGWSRARRAYCRELAQWMRREKAYLPLDSDKAFLAALESGTLAEFLAVTPAGANEQNSCRLILEYAAPTEGSLLDYPVYASLIKGLPKTSLWQMLRNMRRTVLRQAQLHPSEVLTLRPLFPQLAQLLTLQHEELRDLPPDVLPTAATLTPPSDENTLNEVARVWPVPERFRQRVRSKGYALWVNLVGLTPIVFLAIGGALVGGGLWLVIEKAVPLGWIAVPFGVPLFLWGVYIAKYCAAVPENRWIERRLRREISQRPDFLVDPRDIESLYASLIPRENFVKVKFTLSSDLFLLKIDEEKQRLLIEGDYNRYSIPRGAIAVCEPQCFFHPIDHQQRVQIWVVRLMVQFEEGLREMLLCHSSTNWRTVTNKRRRQLTEDLCLRINGRTE
jgi:hypothetical protein